MNRIFQIVKLAAKRNPYRSQPFPIYQFTTQQKQQEGKQYHPSETKKLQGQAKTT